MNSKTKNLQKLSVENLREAQKLAYQDCKGQQDDAVWGFARMNRELVDSKNRAHDELGIRKWECTGDHNHLFWLTDQQADTVADYTCPKCGEYFE